MKTLNINDKINLKKSSLNISKAIVSGYHNVEISSKIAKLFIPNNEKLRFPYEIIANFPHEEIYRNGNYRKIYPVHKDYKNLSDNIKNNSLFFINNDGAKCPLSDESYIKTFSFDASKCTFNKGFIAVAFLYNHKNF